MRNVSCDGIKGIQDDQCWYNLVDSCHKGMNNIGNTNNDISVTERSNSCNDDNGFIKRDMNYYNLL